MRTKNRNFKKNSIAFLKNINLQIFNLNFSRGVTVIGAIVSIVSLFLPWISINDNGKSIIYNSFSPISGNVGFINFLMLFLIIFLIFGGNYNEKMKLYSDIDIKNYLVILFCSIFLIFSGFMCVSFSIGLETFGGKEVKYGSGVILSITSAIFILIGGFLVRKDFYKNSSEIILEKLNRERERKKSNENITLPF